LNTKIERIPTHKSLKAEIYVEVKMLERWAFEILFDAFLAY